MGTGDALQLAFEVGASSEPFGPTDHVAPGGLRTTGSAVRWPSAGNLVWPSGSYSDVLAPDLTTAFQEHLDAVGGMNAGEAVNLWLWGVTGTTGRVGFAPYFPAATTVWTACP